MVSFGFISLAAKFLGIKLVPYFNTFAKIIHLPRSQAEPGNACREDSASCIERWAMPTLHIQDRTYAEPIASLHAC